MITLHFVQKLYTEAWDEDKTMYYPYSDSPELRRVAKAQEVLSDVSKIYYLYLSCYSDFQCAFVVIISAKKQKTKHCIEPASVLMCPLFWYVL